jgi:hypothetical protein
LPECFAFASDTAPVSPHTCARPCASPHPLRKWRSVHMSRMPYLLDQVVCTVGLLIQLTTAASRWAQSSFSLRLQHCALNCLFLILWFLSNCKPDAFHKKRTAIIVIVKAVTTLSRVRKQVRLNELPTGWLAVDLVNTLCGELPCVCTCMLLHAAWSHQDYASGGTSCRAALVRCSPVGAAANPLAGLDRAASPAPYIGFQPRGRLQHCGAWWTSSHRMLPR